MKYIKQKIYRSLALLFIAVLSTGALIAQPGYHSDNNDRRYDNDRDDYKGGRSRDYDNDNNYRNRNYDYRDYSQYKVRHRPSNPRFIQSRRPSPSHIWIDGDWIYDRGSYRYQPGYWVMPNHGRSFVPGHWERVRHGWYWMPGYWTRGGRW